MTEADFESFASMFKNSMSKDESMKNSLDHELMKSKPAEKNGEATVGEKRVRASFNPANNSVVDQIKQKSAELINLCEELKTKDGRLASLAQTTYEEAAMWAVKAATA